MTLPDKGHILVVEKNDITRKLIVGILNSKGLDTFEARDGDGAVMYLSKNLTLVIMDVEPGNLDNMGLVARLRLDGDKLPVIALTAGEDLAQVKERLALKNISVITKPVMPDALINDIQSHLVRDVEREIAAQPAPAPEPAPIPELTAKREEFMRRAVDLSQEKMHENCGGPFGAVIVKGGSVIAEGWNEVTSSGDPTAHAEITAIRKAAAALKDYNLSGCEIYTSCEPCPMCLAAIYWARIDRIFFGNTREDAAKIGFDDDLFYRELALPDQKRTVKSVMMLRDEAQIAFREWADKPDKVPY